MLKRATGDRRRKPIPDGPSTAARISSENAVGDVERTRGRTEAAEAIDGSSPDVGCVA